MKRFIITGITAAVLSLSGCTGNKKEENYLKSIEKEINKSVEDFNNNPVYKLTEKTIDTTDDKHLMEIVFFYLSKEITNYNKEFEIVSSWNKSKQAIYITEIWEAEVNNGGHNQFYANSSGRLNEFLPDALKLIGAVKNSELAKKANETFEKENAKITQYQDGTVKGFSKSYENNPLNKYDDEFYDLKKTENLEQLQVNFIRKHKAEFGN
ncbi:DMP19 family protein [Flavobacterium gelatinilyticum]|uniref:DMP19 family protein n=1 Tax=Flavobacterium gelatinilyticum TaxID=3003260 RepID=UPI002480492B|nr:DUF4375 domain-containing protein [Flavobacterium gelatinilyticum]